MKGVSIRQIRPIVLAVLLVNIAAIPLLAKPNATYTPSVVYAPPVPNIFTVPENLSDLALQSGSQFSIDINISYVEDCYAYQVMLNWTPSMLDIHYASFAGFLPGAAPFMRPNNVEGYIILGETLQGGGYGVDGEGRLATLNFTVQDYGSTEFPFDMRTSPAVTYVLDHWLIEQDITTTDGYFRNMGPGDANADNTVDIFDIGKISSHWYPGPPAGPAGYNKDADMNLDGSVDIFDIGITSANWGNPYP
ncbi:MAG: hypothetical protein PVF15_05820 [Candidatus Bathyarchaeota archaeon]|jgi:hypothetical protein